METKIKARREELDMSQEDLANKAKVSRTIISQLENGSRSVVTSKTMLNIANALDSRIEEIFLI